MLTIATQCITDWFACAVAGCNEPLVTMLCDEFADYTGPCSVIGRPLRLTAGQAALLNGAMGHALDFDDTHTKMGGHPTVPMLPAALAVAELLDRSGADLVAAFVAGFGRVAR